MTKYKKIEQYIVVEKKVNITINTNIWKVVKSKAPLEDKTVNQWVVDAINEKLAKYKTGGKNG